MVSLKYLLLGKLLPSFRKIYKSKKNLTSKVCFSMETRYSVPTLMKYDKILYFNKTTLRFQVEVLKVKLALLFLRGTLSFKEKLIGWQA